MKPVFCKLARPGLRLPYPGANRLFSDRGETVDIESPFWRRALIDGDIVEADETEPGDPASENEPAAKPAKRKG